MTCSKKAIYLLRNYEMLMPKPRCNTKAGLPCGSLVQRAQGGLGPNILIGLFKYLMGSFTVYRFIYIVTYR